MYVLGFSYEQNIINLEIKSHGFQFVGSFVLRWAVIIIVKLNERPVWKRKTHMQFATIPKRHELTHSLVRIEIALKCQIGSFAAILSAWIKQ